MPLDTNARPRIALPTAEKANSFIARYPTAKPEERGTEAVRVLLRDLKDKREQLRAVTESGDAAGTLRERIRELEEENDELSRKVPAPDQVLISKADNDELVEYRKLGKPAEVATKIDEAGKVSGRVVEIDRATAAETAAKASGYNVDATKQIAKDLGLVFELKDETIDNKVVKVAYVKRASDPKETPAQKFSDFAKANPIYLPALQAKGAAGSQGGTGNDFVSPANFPTAGTQSSEQSQQSGTVFPVSTQSDTAPQSGDTVDKFIKGRDDAAKKRGNPLRPAQSTTK